MPLGTSHGEKEWHPSTSRDSPPGAPPERSKVSKELAKWLRSLRRTPPSTLVGGIGSRLGSSSWSPQFAALMATKCSQAASGSIKFCTGAFSLHPDTYKAQTASALATSKVAELHLLFPKSFHVCHGSDSLNHLTQTST